MVLVIFVNINVNFIYTEHFQTATGLQKCFCVTFINMMWHKKQQSSSLLLIANPVLINSQNIKAFNQNEKLWLVNSLNPRHDCRLYQKDGQLEMSSNVKPKHLDHPQLVGCSYVIKPLVLSCFRWISAELKPQCTTQIFHKDGFCHFG